MGAGELLAVTAIMVVGGAVQASLGFGALLLAAPVVALVDIDLVPGATSLAAAALVVLTAWRDRHAADLRGAGWVLAGRLPGTVLGAAAVGLLPERSLQLFFGGLLIVAVAISAWTPHFARRPPLLAGAGALSGVMATATSVGGPPIALVYQRESGPTIRGTLSAIFLVGSAMTLVALGLVGELGAKQLAGGAAMTPGIVLGFVASRWTVPRVDGRALRPLVLSLSAAAAALVVVDALA